MSVGCNPATSKLIREHISQAIDGNKNKGVSIIILKFTDFKTID